MTTTDLTKRVDVRLVPAAVAVWGGAAAVQGVAIWGWAAVAIAGVLIVGRGVGQLVLTAGSLLVVLTVIFVSGLAQHQVLALMDAAPAVVLEVRVVEPTWVNENEGRCGWTGVITHLEQTATGEKQLLAQQQPLPALVRTQVVSVCPPPAAGALVQLQGRADADPRLTVRAPTWHQVSAPVGLSAVGARWRHSAQMVTARLPAPVGGVVSAMVWGDTSDLDADVRAEVRQVGLSHLLVVSGAHFTLALTVWSVLVVGLRPRMRRWILWVPAGALIVLVGSEPSVLRAAAMAAISWLALNLGRRSVAPAALSATVIVLLVVTPDLAVNWGFALSAMATAGIVTVGRCLTERWAAQMPRELAATLAISLTAQIATLPLVVAFSGNVGMWSLLANIVVSPVIAVTTVTGLIGVLISQFWPAAAAATGIFAGAGASWLLVVAHALSGLPGAVVPWAEGWWGVVAGIGTSISLVVLLCRNDLAPLSLWQLRDALHAVQDRLQVGGKRHQRTSYW